jgi:hypothetical protein
MRISNSFWDQNKKIISSYKIIYFLNRLIDIYSILLMKNKGFQIEINYFQFVVYQLLQVNDLMQFEFLLDLGKQVFTQHSLIFVYLILFIMDELFVCLMLMI